MKGKIILPLVFVFYSLCLQGQHIADSVYTGKINAIEKKILLIKALPPEEKKKYYTVMSDAENRKNVLKSLLQTPETKRDKKWEDQWDLNYSKAVIRLDAVILK